MAGCKFLKSLPVTEEVDMCTINRSRDGMSLWIYRVGEELLTLESYVEVG